MREISVILLWKRKGKSLNVSDVFGRLISETVNNDTITYTYYNNDNLLTITNGKNVTTNVYDEWNRLTSKQENGLTTSNVANKQQSKTCWFLSYYGI